MKDRILQLMQSLHLNQQAFANKTGIAPATLSNIFSGRSRPTLQHVEALMKTLPNLNLNWIMSGQGEMFTLQSMVNGADTDSPLESTNSPAPSPSTDNMTERTITAPTEPDLFSVGQNSIQQQPPRTPSPSRPSPPSRSQAGNVPSSPVSGIKIQSHPARRITEIRVFYDDQTWESFVPKK